MNTATAAQQQHGTDAAILVTEAFIAGRLTERDMAFARMNRRINQRRNVSHRPRRAEAMPVDDTTEGDAR